MLPEIDVLQMLILGLLGLGIFIVYKSYTGGSAKSPKKFTTPIFLFTRRREVYELMVENKGNIMLPERGYGYVERVKAVIIYRYGRVWKQYFDPKVTENSRKRKQIYVVRENDPAPLEIDNFKGGYRGETVTKEELEIHQDANTRTATFEGLLEGSPRDEIARRMSVAVIVSVSITMIVWLLVALTKGDLL